MIKKLFFLCAFIPSILVAQHSIKGTFSPPEDYKWIMLYKVTPTTSIYVENAEIDEKGNFEFSMDSTINEGVYRIVYGIPQEEYNFDVIYNAKENIELTFSSDKGVEFIKSKENKLLTSFTKSMMMVNQTINNFYSKANQDEETFNKIFRTLKEAQTSFEDASKGTIAYNFIKANASYIPEEYEDVKTYSQNLRANYLKHVDFNNPILQSSEFLVQRMLGYVFGMTSNPNDLEAFKSSVNDIAIAIENTDRNYQKTLFKILWNQFVGIENETIANHIATEYLLPISAELEDNELSKEVTVYKNTSINSQAPEFSFELSTNSEEKELIKLSDLNSHQRYVVLFWSSSCAHCLKELPELKKYINSLKKRDAQVIAIGMETEPFNWNIEILNYPDFIHVYGEGKWDNPIGDHYGITATPTYFVLDKDKKIIAKPFDFMALKEYMDKNPILLED